MKAIGLIIAGLWRTATEKRPRPARPSRAFAQLHHRLVRIAWKLGHFELVEVAGELGGERRTVVWRDAGLVPSGEGGVGGV
jgi:hypothetical protein